MNAKGKNPKTFESLQYTERRNDKSRTEIAKKSEAHSSSQFWVFEMNSLAKLNHIRKAPCFKLQHVRNKSRYGKSKKSALPQQVNDKEKT